MLTTLNTTGGKRTVQAILALITLSFGVLILLSYRSIDKELTDAALSRRASIADLAAATLSEKFERVTDIGVSLAIRQQVRDLISEGKWTEAGNYLEDITENFPFVDRVFLSDPNGTLMAFIPGESELIGKNFAFREWYQGVSRNWTPYVSPIYKRANEPQQNIFSVAVPIRDRSSKVTGILVMQVQLGVFIEWTKNIGIGQGGSVFVVDSKGQIAFHPNLHLKGETRDISKAPVIQRLLRGATGVEIMIDPIDGDRSVIAFAPTQYGWGVIAEQPVTTAFAARNSQLRLLLMGYALILLLCICVFYLAWRLAIRHGQASEERRIKAELENRVAERTDQLQKVNIELENAMRSKDRFLAGMSHELRTPLNAIIGFTGTLLMKLPGPLNADQEKQLKTIQSSARHQLTLINDLLDIAKIESGKLEIAREPVEPRAVADEVIESMRPLAVAKSLELVAGVAEAVPTAYTDRRAVIQILLNFASNAIKFTEQGTVSLTVRPRRDNGVNCIEFSVADTGIGIRPEDQARLFGAFEQVGIADARRHAGSGLGLHLSRKLATLLGGRIEFTSEYGKGSRFTLILREG